MASRRLRWWRGALLALLVFLITGAVASWAILRVYGPRFTRDRVEAALGEALGQPVRVGAVQLRPWLARLSLADLATESGASSADRARLRVPSVDVIVGVDSLWRRELVLSVVLSDLELEVESSLGEAGEQHLFPLPDVIALGPVRVRIGTIRLMRAHAAFRVPDRALALELRGADISASPDAGDLDVSLRVDTVGLDAFGRREEVTRVSGDARLSADRLRVGRLGWHWQGAVMKVDGELRHPWDAARELGLRLAGDLPLAALASRAGLGLEMSGTASFAADVAGPLASPRVAGRVSISELGIARATAREVVVRGDWADGALRLDEIRARFGTGYLTGRLSAQPAPAGGTKITLDLPDVTLPAPLTGLGRGVVGVEAWLHSGAIELQRAEATWRDATITIGGRIDTRGPLAVRARLSADLRGAARAAGLGQLAGRATTTAELSGSVEAPVLAGRADVADLVVSGHAVEPIEASFKFAAHGDAPSLARWEGIIQLPRIRSGGATVDDLMASLTVDGRQVDLTRARAKAGGIPVEATGIWRWEGSGRAHATLGPVALGSVFAVPPALRLGGGARGQLDVSLERNTTVAALAVQLEQVSAAGVSLGGGTMDVNTRGTALRADLAFPARKLRIDAAGRLEPGMAITARLALDDLALRPLLRELGSGAADQVDGRVSSRGEASIPFDAPAGGRGTIRVEAAALRLLDEPWASRGPIVIRWEGGRALLDRFRLDGPAGDLSASGVLASADGARVTMALDNARLPGALAELGRGAARADVRFAGGAVEVARLDGQWPGVTVAVTGRVQPDGAIGIDGQVDAELARLRQLAGNPTIGGRATLSAQARGRWDGLEGTGHLKSPGLQVLGATVSDVDIPFRFSRTALRVQDAEARLGTTRITGAGTAMRAGNGPVSAEALASDLRFTAALRAPAARLEDLSPLLPTAARGRGDIAFTAQAEGSLRQWRGGGTLTSARLDLTTGPLRQLQSSFTVDSTRIEMSELRVEAYGAPVRATASWAWAGGGRASATLGPASLAALSILPSGLGLQGKARATIEVTAGAPADLTGALRVALDDGAIGGVSLGQGRLDVSLRDRIFSADLAFPERQWKATGSGRLDADNVLTGEVAIADLALGPVLRGLLPAAGPLDGALSARASVRLPLFEPRRGDGVLSIAPFRLVAAGESWESRGPIEVRWAAGALRLPNLDLAGGEGSIRGSGSVSADGVLDARTEARLPLAMLATIRPEIREAGGRLELSLRAAGAINAPTLTGDGAIHQGSLLLRDRPETMREFEARLSLSSQGLRLREASGTLGGGRIQAQGQLALDGWRIGSYRLRLVARDVGVAPVEGLSSAWDADLELSGLDKQASLQGDARLVRGMYSRDLSLLSLALSSSRPAVAASDEGSPLRLRLRVALDDNLSVRNRTVDLRAGGVLNVEGTTAKPIVFGSVESRDGRIVFRGHDFIVTTATVRFADPRRIDPFLDVVATSRIREYDVTVQVTGQVSDLSIRLSSSPRLSQDDLLALLTLGATRAELKESPASILAAEGGKLLVRDLLGMDPTITGLRVSTGSSSTDSSTPGAPWDERARTSPSTSTTGDRRDRVRIEYQLLDPLYLSAEYDREGGYGLDLVVRFRFR